ncbi:unnamed protein product [Pseudo-nitzschia multistriata]|uniref:Uncharacterized protein n=1 Tax=Pseudo-nitzschia multistriata TaxID=183589 RepID=A0A448Z3U6_9STRA|nr:unnamed protein product [Pseudo-nitzschia multistriata]VEU40562.1 unnamed protein product [Pseudo-nitzschia multistriata]
MRKTLRKLPSLSKRGNRTTYDYNSMFDDFPGVQLDEEGFPSSSDKRTIISNIDFNTATSNTSNNPTSNTSTCNSSSNGSSINFLTSRIRTSRGRRLSQHARGREQPETSDGPPLFASIGKPPRSRSADPLQLRRKSTATATRGRDNSVRSRGRSVARSCSPSAMRSTIRSHSLSNIRNTYRSVSPSARTGQFDGSCETFSEPEQRDDSSLTKSARYQLGKDMQVLADGINLDGNTRVLLAAYDARTLDDFYLMADIDFLDFLRKARAANNCLPPLQIRKVRMLRRWLKDLVDENMSDENEEHSRRSRRRRLVPKDWAEQYKHDLPHLKLELRQQGDSLFERFSQFGNALTSVVTGCSTPTGYL